MREEAQKLEDGRLEGLELSNYPWFHERHRIFPDIFEKGIYKKILDTAAGVGVVAKRIQDNYDCFMLCNDISEQSLKSLIKNNLATVSFDLDDPETSFPFPDETFDAIISLATLEHIINLDHHISEIWRLLKYGGHLYISTPNYTSIHFLVPFVLNGRTFHNPLKEGIPKYEFYAHVRYFTYKTLVDFISFFGFQPEKVYLPLPKSSTKFLALKERSSLIAFTIKTLIYLFYFMATPRWAFHPVLCFSKTHHQSLKKHKKPKKIIL